MNFRITDDVSEHDVNEIHGMLKEYNLAHREQSNWLCIQFLFVSEQLREQGIGSKLLEAAKSEAKQRGCKYAFVDTFSFQAPIFYKKHGYQEVFTLEEYPYTEKRHYYTKNLF